MKIEKLKRADAHLADDLAVVIDVIRAFTTAACAFHQGAKEIILVSSVDDAFRTANKHAGSLVMGEIDGAPVEGFDMSNSPKEILQRNLTGKTLVQRTTAGTQGVLLAKHAKVILASSFVVAQATYRRILEIGPKKVSFIITGVADGSEDLALADYLEAMLLNGTVEPSLYIRRALESRYAKEFGKLPYLPREDLELCGNLDRYDFYMQVERTASHYILKAGK